jgi:hypothetical protein
MNIVSYAHMHLYYMDATNKFDDTSTHKLICGTYVEDKKFDDTSTHKLICGMYVEHKKND